jgi:hypothetical protein
VFLGFEVRVELTLADGSHVYVQTTREQAEELELDRGQIVAVRASGAAKLPGHSSGKPPASAASQ